MQTLNSILSRTSSAKHVFILFIAAHAVLLAMMTYTFPVINQQIDTQAFDLQTFGYDLATATTILENLDSATTQIYLFPQLALFDVLYPVLSALFLSSLLFRLMILSKRKALRVLLIAPFLAMAFDYLENICIALMITDTVPLSTAFVQLSSIFTLLKGVLTAVAWVGVILYFILWLKMKRSLKAQL